MPFSMTVSTRSNTSRVVTPTWLGCHLCHLVRLLRKLGVEPQANVPVACQAALQYNCSIFRENLTNSKDYRPQMNADTC